MGPVINRPLRRRQILLGTALAVLALRAFTPDGYMPASPGSGLLFELCPDGMPAEVMQALAGDGHNHHHGSVGDTADSVSGTEQCPIGHMLASAVAHDADVVVEFRHVPEVPTTIPVIRITGQRHSSYRSRAPPA